MMRHRTLGTLALGLSLLGGAAAAAPAYHVELVVFRHAQGDQEPPTPVSELDASDQVVDLDQGTEDGYRPLPRTAYALEGVRSKLAEQPGYEPLLHMAWQQPVLAPDTARPVRVTGGNGWEVRGTVQVSERHYIYLNAALQLNAAGPEWGVYQLDEQRRVRLGQFQYLDHPAFGAVVLVKRMEADDTVE